MLRAEGVLGPDMRMLLSLNDVKYLAVDGELQQQRVRQLALDRHDEELIGLDAEHCSQVFTPHRTDLAGRQDVRDFALEGVASRDVVIAAQPANILGLDCQFTKAVTVLVHGSAQPLRVACPDRVGFSHGFNHAAHIGAGQLGVRVSGYHCHQWLSLPAAAGVALSLSRGRTDRVNTTRKDSNP
ncbi:hypothetical protein MTIM_36160 [Mycobacterium timonense]|uniref:Uncharacterized protein n=1 Tax=Mycobacterium timonense TaxID=701043 RepID=A0A7I9ZAJ4_9MYCO|nr:hypothetical protein MTIM_36160 [Mycobacterium timonense]